MIFNSSGAPLTKIARRLGSVISALVGLLVSAGILFAFVRAFFDISQVAKWDLKLPSSLSEIIGGLFLSFIISFLWSLILVAVFAAFKEKIENKFILTAAIIAVLLAQGGILIFVVPTWIAFISFVVATVVAFYGSREKSHLGNGNGST